MPKWCKRRERLVGFDQNSQHIDAIDIFAVGISVCNQQNQYREHLQGISWVEIRDKNSRHWYAVRHTLVLMQLVPAKPLTPDWIRHIYVSRRSGSMMTSNVLLRNLSVKTMFLWDTFRYDNVRIDPENLFKFAIFARLMSCATVHILQPIRLLWHSLVHARMISAHKGWSICNLHFFLLPPPSFLSKR